MMEKTKGFFGEFRAFIARGNVVDMAVGVIIATSFGKITTSLVNDVVLPFLGWLFGGMDFSQLNIVLRQAVMDGDTVVTPAVVIGIGTLIAAIVDFILVAFVVFLLIRTINRARARAEELAKKQAEAVPAAPPEPSAEEKLLMEIRDLLKEQRHGG